MDTLSSYRAPRRPPAVLSRRTLALSAAVLAALGVPIERSHALDWDPGHPPSAPSGGAGTWDYATVSWSNGATDIPWNSSLAVFGGNAGGPVQVVTGGTGVLAIGLTFNSAGYVLSGDP